MTPSRLTTAIVGGLLAWAAAGAAASVPVSARADMGLASEVVQYHYTMAARVRPLVLFWFTRSGVGDAVVTRRRAPGETDY